MILVRLSMSLELDQQRVFGVSTLCMPGVPFACMLSDLSGEASPTSVAVIQKSGHALSKVLAVESLGPQEVFLLSASYELRHQVCPVHLCSAVHVACRITLIPLESCL